VSAGEDAELKELLDRVKLRLLRGEPEEKTCCPRTSRRPIEVASLRELLDYVKKCKAVFVTFYSPTCPYCRAFAPIYAEAAEAYGDKIPFLRVNTYTLPEAAQLFGVRGVPSTFGIVDGRVEVLLYGLVDEGRLEEAILRVLEKAGCPVRMVEGVY